MTDSGLEKVVSAEQWQLGASDTPASLLDAYITVFQYQNGKLWTKGLLSLAVGGAPTYAQYTTGAVNPYVRVLSAYNTTGAVPYFDRSSQVTLFDAAGNPEETQLLGRSQYKAMIWDPYTGQKLAEAANTRFADIAYSGFDEIHVLPGTVSATVTVGNLRFYTGYEKTSPSLTGQGRCYALTAPFLSGQPPCTITGTQTLSAGRAYRLTFWASGVTPVIKTGTATIASTAIKPVYTRGSWTFYEVRFQPAAAGTLSIGQNGTSTTYLDEVRLYPAGAQMYSRTYEPLFGIRSENDATEHYTWYEYDSLGRISAVHDRDGNVLSRTTYTLAP